MKNSVNKLSNATYPLLLSIVWSTQMTLSMRHWELRNRTTVFEFCFHSGRELPSYSVLRRKRVFTHFFSDKHRPIIIIIILVLISRNCFFQFDWLSNIVPSIQSVPLKWVAHTCTILWMLGFNIYIHTSNTRVEKTPFTCWDVAYFNRWSFYCLC